jgi:SAM-dependent methyltransferase
VVVGCGPGHEVAALAEKGFDALGLDFAAEAVAATQALLAGRKLPGRAEQADLFALPGAHAPFDLWVEHTCFCAIDPARRDEYVQAAANSLVPGGRLLGLFYAHGRPGGPPFATTPAEVRARFGARFDVESLELAKDSHPRRKGEEWLGVLVRR